MIKQLPYPVIQYRLYIVVLLHALFAAGALTISFLLRFDFTLGGARYLPYLLWSLPINVLIFMTVASFFNLYQGIWRYVSVDDLKDILKTSALSSALFFCIIGLSGRFEGYPRSILLMNFALFVFLNGGTRFAIRMYRESFAPQSDTARNLLIVGAGTAGNEVAKTIKAARNREYIPVGFIDNDKACHGKRLQGLKILGEFSQLRMFILKYRVHEVFIAIPEATNKVVKQIIDYAKIPEWDVKFKIVPSMLDIMSGKLKVNQIRDVSINDLLSRPNITLDDTHVRKQLAGKVVVITGAGGSIGSELSFQIAAYKPSRLILIDASEENAYTIDLNLKKQHADIAIHTVVGSILDTSVLELLFRKYKPDFVFHAAAYKHVHLMEWNPLACFKNNVIGTGLLAALAERYGVGQFVMISTDKAVNPRGIMGLSKRLAERVVLERHQSKTLFNIVRFGNVLGSSGSVIPLFQKQIREGGPVTVTSPETRRFFMSIPEAVQLVLQASTLHEKNAIFLLDMGEPVYIADLAKNLIELSGLRVGEDIEIVFSGMRVGEKIEEELLSAQENVVETQFDKIRLQKNVNFDPDRIARFLHDLKSSVELGNIRTIYEEVCAIVPEMKDMSFEEMSKNMFA